MSIVTVTIPFPGGTATMSDSTAVAIAAQTTANEKLWGVLAANTPGTPASNLATVAESTNDMANLLTDVISQQEEMNKNLELLVSILTTVSTNIGTGVTTAQLAYLDQTKNNQFHQKQANEALQRAGLPPTEVKQGELSERVTTTIREVSDLSLQQKVVSVTQDGLTYVSGVVTSVGKDLVTKALDVTGVTALWNAAKKKWATIFPKTTTVRKKTVQTNAVTRGTKSGRPSLQVPIDIDQG